MSQRFALYDELTGRENLAFYAGVYAAGGDPRARGRRVDEVLDLLGLADRSAERAGELSGGWRQRLALGVALVHQPELLFLDEPTSGVDPNARRAFWDLIYALAEQGTTVFVTTHYMDEAERCERVGIMYRGRLLAMDTPFNLERQAFAGAAWEVSGVPLIEGLSALQRTPGVERTGLSGAHLRAITAPGAHSAESLRAALAGEGFAAVIVESADPTLEDVFIALAGHEAQLPRDLAG